MNSKCCVQLCGFTSVPVPMTLNSNARYEYVWSTYGERTAMAIDTIIQDGRGWETAHPHPI